MATHKAKRVGPYELGRTLGEGNFAKARYFISVIYRRWRSCERPKPHTLLENYILFLFIPQVKFATNVETGMHYAVKIINKDRIEEETLAAQIKREIAVMKLVRHPNVVNLIEVRDDITFLHPLLIPHT